MTEGNRKITTGMSEKEIANWLKDLSNDELRILMGETMKCAAKETVEKLKTKINEIKPKLMTNDLVFAKVKPDAIIPTKEAENAGYDIYACFDEDYMIIQAHETKLIPTGVAAAVSE